MRVVSELRGTHRRGWPRRGLCWGFRVSALGVEGGLRGPPLPVALRTENAVLCVLGCAWPLQVHRYLVCSGGGGPIRVGLASAEPSVVRGGWAPPVCGSRPGSELGALPPAEGLSMPRGPRVVWSLPSSVRLRRGVVAPGPELGRCGPQAPVPPVLLLVSPSPPELVPVSLQPAPHSTVRQMRNPFPLIF